jgi:hypothetical protein
MGMGLIGRVKIAHSTARSLLTYVYDKVDKVDTGGERQGDRETGKHRINRRD